MDCRLALIDTAIFDLRKYFNQENRQFDNQNEARWQTRIEQQLRSDSSAIRRKVRGSDDRPRLAVYRSLNHIYAQVIDDLMGQDDGLCLNHREGSAWHNGGNIRTPQARWQSNR